MNQMIKRAFTQNVGLKILALVLSFFLWLVVVNIDDPKQTRTFTTVVTVTNEEVLSAAGKLYEIKDGVNTVSFRVTAKRSIIEKLSSSDFTAVADMKYLEDGERVPVTITSKVYANSISISTKQNYLHVVLEDEITNRFKIEADTTGEASGGLVINEVTCSPNVLTVTGPAEIVESIVHVVATCDITGVSDDISESVIPKLYDAEGKEIDSSRVQISISTVDVHVDFVSLKTVDIAVKTSGTLADGLALGSITTDPVSVQIKGQPANLNDVTTITIPDSVINLSELTGSIAKVVDISAYLPDGVSLMDSSAKNVTVYVNMEGEVSKIVEVSKKCIRFTNIPDGVAVVLDDEPITITAFGLQSVLDAYTTDTVLGSIDCTNVTTEGEHSVILQIDPVPGVTVQNITVNVNATGNAKQTAGETGSENNTDNSTDKTETDKTETEKTESDTSNKTETRTEKDNKTESTDNGSTVTKSTN